MKRGPKIKGKYRLDISLQGRHKYFYSNEPWDEESIKQVKAKVYEPLIERFKQLYSNDYEVVNIDGDKVTLKCKVCGYEFERDIRHTCSSDTKPACKRCYERKERNKYGSREEYLERITKKTKAKKTRPIYHYVCSVCGKEFDTYQKNQKTCSIECRKKRRNYKQDRRINKDNLVDKDITLATLYKRDKGICYICNGLCNWNDMKNSKGYKTVGKTYPTIDHVIPLARGGTHSWDNVRLAHKYCNSIKSAKIDDKYKQPEKDIARALAHELKYVSKKVKQFTLDGVLVNEYRSTIEASKQTGFKAKQIQNCARGEKKTYRGYKWSY
ncbi:MAG: HNH endonuclease [Limosilactobacillus sp.]|uniref:HNH endonuclease n=1 Tax=Limosilactobacillus sp. TaxID=2773925 RepID=UPI002A760007|nr:HNH endonuclease [Limosilactobacillus sp.]MDY2802632.1 HNH endonuclease [Limosilactobacillus sp.]